MEYKVNFVPGENKVLVLPEPPEEKTQNGIIIPDTARRRGNRGKVMAIGTTPKEYPTNLKVGDTVIYGNNFVELNIDGVDYLLMRTEYEILGVC